MANNVLKVENLTMQFGGVVAVNDFSMEINEGEIVSLIGPNGAGKTTAFNGITGVYEVTNGRVTFLDKVIAEGYPTGKMKKLYAGGSKGKYKKLVYNTPDKITAMGMARTFQNIRLFKEQTVFDNVLIAMHLHMKGNFFTDTFRINYKEEKRMRERTEE
ncbi:MAG: ATP-binding cassette domain-containing protein, partial [Oscillospiraceae bacterium]|nr:ATP-binding cassette domain-containing protein [Oscillospiraceae bacterium]